MIKSKKLRRSRKILTLKSIIENWDGKETASLTEAFDEYSQEKDFSDRIVKYARKSELRKGSLWLLKKYLEDKNSLNNSQVQKIIDILPDVNNWESKLHILQSIPYIRIKAKHKEHFEIFIRKNLSDQNTFVRAWALNAFYLLADKFPELRGEAVQFIDSAMETEQASVKARIRNMTKTGFYTEL